MRPSVARAVAVLNPIGEAGVAALTDASEEVPREFVTSGHDLDEMQLSTADETTSAASPAPTRPVAKRISSSAYFS